MYRVFIIGSEKMFLGWKWCLEKDPTRELKDLIKVRNARYIQPSENREAWQSWSMTFNDYSQLQLDVDSEPLELCIVHDRCRDHAAFNPNGRAQNCQLWYENTVKLVMRGHLFGCLNCIILWTKLYFDIEMYLSDTVIYGHPLSVPLSQVFTVWWAIVHLKGFENWPIGLHLKGHWIWMFILPQGRLARTWSHAFLHTSTFEKVGSALG